MLCKNGLARFFGQYADRIVSMYVNYIPVVVKLIQKQLIGMDPKCAGP